MNNTLIAVAVVGLIIAGGAGFYGGMKYQTTQTPTRGAGQFAGGNFAGGNRGGGRGGGANGAFGTIIAKDANSITVQLGGPNATSTNGDASGSKIVLYDKSTQIGKMVTGSPADLTVGQMIIANGTANSDGSITAQMIQIRPAGVGGARDRTQ